MIKRELYPYRSAKLIHLSSLYKRLVLIIGLLRLIPQFACPTIYSLFVQLMQSMHKSMLTN